MRASEERFRALAELAPVGIFFGDADGNVTYVNQRWSEITGWPMARGLGRNWMAGIHPDDRAYVEREQEIIFREQQERRLEYRYLTQEGRQIWIIVNVRPLLDARGVMTGYIGTVLDITARKQAEEALQESETRYRTLFTVEPDALILVDVETQQICAANESAVSLFGYSQEELLTLRIPDISAEPEATRTSIQTTKLHQIDYVPLRYYFRKDGTKFPVELSARSFELSGRILIFAAIRDITERKQTEEALRESEARFRQLLDANIIGIIVADLHGNILEANRAFLELTGYSRDDLLANTMRWTAMTPVEYQAQDERAVQDLLTTGTVLPFEKEYFRKDGSRVPVILGGVLLEGITPPTVLTFVLDISERKRTEARIQQLLQSVEQWAASMDATITAIADGVIIYGPDAEITRINHAAEELFGYTPGMETLPYAERAADIQFASPDGRPVTRAALPPQRALQGETIQGMVLAFTRTDGQQRWLSVSAAPIPSPDGNILGAVATFSDITPLRELQQRLEDLLHIVSHDLRVPLTVIHGHMELLEDALRGHGINSEITLSTSTIDRNVYRMNLMIQDLVDMSRLESRQLTLTLEAVALQSYVPDLLARLQDILPVQRVVTDIAADLPPVRADYSRLERILLNLLTNAFKYSAPETPVRIHAFRQGDEIVITVSDQGRGIAPADLPHLFERFYRVGGERKQEGLGLGLYITRVLVEAHGLPTATGTAKVGGRVWVESEVGKGSTFFFTLPIMQQERHQA